MRGIKIIRQGFASMFGQYGGLRRELYVLFWGKAATNMGAMIWPMLDMAYADTDTQQQAGDGSKGDRRRNHQSGSHTVSGKSDRRKAGGSL